MKLEIDIDSPEFVDLVRKDMEVIHGAVEPSEQEVKEYLEEMWSDHLAGMREYLEEQYGERKPEDGEDDQG